LQGRSCGIADNLLTINFSHTKQFFTSVKTHLLTDPNIPVEYRNIFLIWERINAHSKQDAGNDSLRFAASFLKTVLLAMGEEDNLCLATSSDGKIKIVDSRTIATEEGGVVRSARDDISSLEGALKAQVTGANELLRTINETEAFDLLNAARPDVATWLRQGDFSHIKAALEANKQPTSSSSLKY